MYRHFHKNSSTSLNYEEVRPVLNQPAQLHATAKTHKFDDYSQITAQNLKLRPIISTCGTYFYETAKALSKYLAPLAEDEHTIKDKLDFAGNLENRSVNEDEILVSYDVTSLTEIPLQETSIDHVLEEIYDHSKLPQITSKLVMKRLLERVTKETVFSFNGKLYQQTNGCSLGNPLSPTLANIFMCELEMDIVTPRNIPFYDRYVDDCFTKRKTDVPDQLLESLNSYHPNIQFTVEKEPTHFLDTAFTVKGRKFSTSVYKKPSKQQVHWKSAVAKKWKKNTITGALHRAKRIISDWQSEVKTIKQSFENSGYPPKFVQGRINEFENRETNDTIIPVHWFDERTNVGIRLPFRPKNEFDSRKFIRKLNSYTSGKNLNTSLFGKHARSSHCLS